MRSIFIATPSYQTPSPAYYASILATIPALEAAGHRVQWREWEHCCYVHTARNKLVREFLFSGLDDLLFIDNDLGWNADEMVRLCAHEFDIVGAAAPFRHGPEGFPVCVRKDQRGLPRIDNESGLIETDVLPTAVMKISRAALMKLAGAGLSPLRIEYARNGEESGRYLSFFDFEIDNESHFEFGEDVTFCRKWLKAGGKLLVDMDLTITHFGPNFRTGNLREHLYGAKKAAAA